MIPPFGFFYPLVKEEGSSLTLCSPKVTSSLLSIRIHQLMESEHISEASRVHSGKESACQCVGRIRCVFDPWMGKILWRRKWQPIPVFLPGASHGQRSLVGYSPWGHKESDTAEATEYTGVLG